MSSKDQDYFLSEFDEDILDFINKSEKFKKIKYCLKLNIQKNIAVLHFDEKCAGNEGNLIKIDTYEEYLRFNELFFTGFNIFNCPLCKEAISEELIYSEFEESSQIKFKQSVMNYDIDEIPF